MYKHSFHLLLALNVPLKKGKVWETMLKEVV